jgi:hypothetical protein
MNQYKDLDIFDSNKPDPMDSLDGTHILDDNLVALLTFPVDTNKLHDFGIHRIVSWVRMDLEGMEFHRELVQLVLDNIFQTDHRDNSLDNYRLDCGLLFHI